MWVFVAVLIASSLGFAFAISPAMQKTQVTYLPHPVIEIHGPEQLDTQASDEGWLGNGTEESPYLITGWEVSALGSTAGIYVGNTSDHFVISNCYVHDASAACILLFNVTNATVIGNVCENSQHGVDVVSSQFVEVVGNNCTMAFDGIRIVSSSKCNLTGNDCTGNLVGLAAHDSDNLTFESNNMSYNVVSGIHLNHTNRSSAVNNTCTWNQYGTYMTGCSLVYLNSTEWDDNRDGGLWMYHCYDVSAERNRARDSYNGPGLRMEDSGRCTLAANSVERCGEGISCSGSDGCGIWDNHCSGNYGDGIRAEGSGRCMVSDNECSDNGGHGVSTGMCNDGWVERNRCTRNEGDGISSSDGQRCDIRDNTCTDNDGSEIRCHNLDYCNVTSNIINSSAGNGIALEISSLVNVSDNICSDLSTGISVHMSTDCTAYNNSVLDCTFGIVLSDSLDILLRENVMTNDGIFIDGTVPQLWNSHEIGPTNLVNGLPVRYLVSAVGVDILGTPGQIILAECTDVAINGLDLSNATVGVAVAFSDGISISNCTSSDGYIGVYGLSSSTVDVKNATCDRNSRSGIELVYCTMCRILEAACEDNVEFGIRLDASVGSEVAMCDISGSGTGVYTGASPSAGTFAANEISNCTSGVMVSSAEHIEVGFNDIRDCGYGVKLESSPYLAMTGNTFTGCGLYISSDFLNHWNTHSIDPSNTVNGLPLVYLANASGLSLPPGAGQVVFANCSFMSVVSTNLSDCTVGVQAGFSDHISIVSCVMSGNQVGIGLAHTDDSQVLSNTIWGCGSDGVSLSGANRNTVVDNMVTGSGTGIGLYVSTIYASMNNQVLFNNASENVYGVVLVQSPENLVENNTFFSNLACGVLVGMSDLTVIRNNTCTGSGDMAISISGSNGCAVVDNSCSMNFRGIYLWSSSGSNLSGNILYGSNEYGICLDSACVGNRIWDNVFAYNNGSLDSYDPFHIQACDDGDNQWNTSGSPTGVGNYWHDWTTPDFDGDDIVDEPYNITGDAGAKDYFPKASTSVPIEPIPEFSTLAALGLLVLVVLLMARRKRD